MAEEMTQAEIELRDIRSRMEAALAGAAIGTWSWDICEDRFFGDSSLARIFSLPLELVTEDHCLELLSLVRGLVEMHGGSVRAAGYGEGQRSTFTAILPVLDGRDAATPADDLVVSQTSVPRKNQ